MPISMKHKLLQEQYRNETVIGAIVACGMGSEEVAVVRVRTC